MVQHQNKADKQGGGGCQLWQERIAEEWTKTIFKSLILTKLENYFK